jgi:hypothetical protein
MALTRFQGPIGLHSLALEQRDRGPLARSPIREEVWETLRKHRVLAFHTMPGRGPDSAMKVVDEARADVHQFLANGLATGVVERAIADLARNLS